MAQLQHLLPRIKNNRGATIVIVAIFLTVLIGFVALAVDIGYMYATRNELQNVADAAALAGAGYLGSVYATLSYSNQQNYTFKRDDVFAVVDQVAEKNKAAGLQISIVNSEDDLIIGTWNGNTVDATLNGPDAVQVTARRDGTANTAITSFFAQIIGINEIPLSAVATAALTGPAVVDDGKLKTPFGLSENVFPNDCKDIIDFRSTKISCAGWHNFFDPINANAEAEKLLGFIQSDTTCAECGAAAASLINGPAWLEANFDIKKNKTPPPATTPQTAYGDDYQFQGGVISSLLNGGVLDPATYNGNTGTVIGVGNDSDKLKAPLENPAPMQALFDYFRYRDDDGDNTIWTATVPVYEDNDDGSCSNPGKDTPIVGFAKIVVKMPNSSPATIDVSVDCKQSFVLGRGGGSIYGNLKGTIPNLVK
jgi:Flp pilus assembly protein TadG